MEQTEPASPRDSADRASSVRGLSSGNCRVHHHRALSRAVHRLDPPDVRVDASDPGELAAENPGGRIRGGREAEQAC
jgi:hypothetical protein